MTSHPLVYRATFLDQIPKQCNRRLDQGQALNTSSGELRPHMCGANSCPYCAKVKRRQIVRAVGAAEPTAFLTLTLAGDEFSLIQTRMRNLHRSLKRSGWPMEWVWLVECNTSSKHLHHVHGLAHGSVPDEGTFIEHAQRSGFGLQSEISSVKSIPQAAAYLWGMDTYKRPAGKPRKHRVIDVPHFLAMNGGRFQHSTRGFWRVKGLAVGGMDKAVAATRA